MPVGEIAVFNPLIAILLFLVCRIESRIETFFKKETKREREIVFETWSLKVFKCGRASLCIFAGFEVLDPSGITAEYSFLGFALFALGVGLRVEAIRSLGETWSYHPVRFSDHRIVTRGVYRLLKHPAYLGNIYLPGLLLTVGAELSALYSTAFVIVFYLYRTRVEAELLLGLEETNR